MHGVDDVAHAGHEAAVTVHRLRPQVLADKVNRIRLVQVHHVIQQFGTVVKLLVADVTPRGLVEIGDGADAGIVEGVHRRIVTLLIRRQSHIT